MENAGTDGRHVSAGAGNAERNRVRDEERLQRRGFVWNMIGSAVYAITSMLLGTAVTRLLGADAGGIFLFAFSTLGQHIYIVSYFGMRPLQITDTAGRYSFGDYRKLRHLTCGAALLCALVFGLVYSGISQKTGVILLMAVFKILDGLADCYESEYQRQGRLDLTGISLTLRTLLVVLCFLSAMAVSRNLLLSCMVADLALLAGVMLLCMRPLRTFPRVDYTEHPGAAKELFHAGKWLFISAFLDLFVFSASKYAIDATQSAAVSGYYAILFIPTSVVNLMANFVIRPVLTRLSSDYEEGRPDSIRSAVKKISALIGGITLLGMAAAWLIGIPVLGLFTGKEAAADLLQYRFCLVILIAGGGFYAVLNLMYYVLVIFRKQREIFRIYLGGTVLAAAISFGAASRYGIPGAAVSYLICMLLVTAAFTGVTIHAERGFRHHHTDLSS